MVPLEDGTTYRVVANNFLSDGGDSFAAFKDGTNKLIGGLDIDSLRDYLLATARSRRPPRTGSRSRPDPGAYHAPPPPHGGPGAVPVWSGDARAQAVTSSRSPTLLGRRDVEVAPPGLRQEACPDSRLIPATSTL